MNLWKRILGAWILICVAFWYLFNPIVVENQLYKAMRLRVEARKPRCVSDPPHSQQCNCYNESLVTP